MPKHRYSWRSQKSYALYQEFRRTAYVELRTKFKHKIGITFLTHHLKMCFGPGCSKHCLIETVLLSTDNIMC